MPRSSFSTHTRRRPRTTTKYDDDGRTHGSFTDGSEYTPDQCEFIKAVAAWRQTNGRHPTDAELLAIAKSLGYAKGEM